MWNDNFLEELREKNKKKPIRIKICIIVCMQLKKKGSKQTIERYQELLQKSSKVCDAI